MDDTWSTANWGYIECETISALMKTNGMQSAPRVGNEVAVRTNNKSNIKKKPFQCKPCGEMTVHFSGCMPNKNKAGKQAEDLSV